MNSVTIQCRYSFIFRALNGRDTGCYCAGWEAGAEKRRHTRNHRQTPAPQLFNELMKRPKRWSFYFLRSSPFFLSPSLFCLSLSLSLSFFPSLLSFFLFYFQRVDRVPILQIIAKNIMTRPCGCFVAGFRHELEWALKRKLSVESSLIVRR